MTNDDELRRRGIEFLMSQRKEDKKGNEFNVVELSKILNIASTSVYEHMEVLVKAKIWGKRKAYDQASHRTVFVWWLLDQQKEDGS